MGQRPRQPQRHDPRRHEVVHWSEPICLNLRTPPHPPEATIQGPARTTILVLAALTLTGCATTPAPNAAAAAAGTIQQDAPIKAHVQIYIAAPPDRVWQLLIDVPNWPKWADQIDSVDITTPLAIGTRFTWKTNGTTIHSEVHLFDPHHRLSWTGTALTARAVHIWQLDPTTITGTTVTVDESMSGPLLTWMYSSAKLNDSDTTWLTALKQAAEHPNH